MRLLKTSHDLYSRFLLDVIFELPSTIFISTFGLWCGIDKDGKATPQCTTHRLLDYLNSNGGDCDTTIVVGYGSNIPEVVIETARVFRNITFVPVKDYHSKCIITSTGILCVGSSNLNDSSWAELNVYDMVETNSENYTEVLHHVRWHAFFNTAINPDEIPKVDISDLTRNSRLKMLLGGE